jgi:hypothetical protein
MCNLSAITRQADINYAETRMKLNGFQNLLAGIIHGGDADCRMKFFQCGTVVDQQYVPGRYEYYSDTIRWEIQQLLLVFFVQYQADEREIQPPLMAKCG